MGHLKDIKSNLDPQAFPGATFEIAGEVPQAQCSEAQIEGDDATTDTMMLRLYDTNKFAGWDLADKVCHITASVGGNTGDFLIISNNPDHLQFVIDPGDGDPVEYHITDGPELILTRDVQSFAQFLHQAGHPYTIKGGKLYTSVPYTVLQNACTILFHPLT